MEALRIKTLREAQMIGKLDTPTLFVIIFGWKILGLQVYDKESEDEFSDEDYPFVVEDIGEDPELGSTPLFQRQKANRFGL